MSVGGGPGGRSARTCGGEARWYFSKPDYFLTRAGERKKLRRCRWVTPPKSNSDHRALVVRLQLERDGAGRHVRRMTRFPFKLPATGPATEGEKMFEMLKGGMDKVPPREWEESAWIRPGTWALIDERSKLRALHSLSRAGGGGG